MEVGVEHRLLGLDGDAHHAVLLKHLAARVRRLFLFFTGGGIGHRERLDSDKIRKNWVLSQNGLEISTLLFGHPSKTACKFSAQVPPMTLSFGYQKVFPKKKNLVERQ